MSVMNWKPRYSKHLRLGRLQLNFILYVHKYVSGSGDRWVIRPELIWDRKDKK